MMNRHDWVFVGIRLLGVFLLVQGCLGLPVLLDCNPRVKAEAPIILDPILRAAAGAFLAFGTLRICRWLGDHSREQ